MGGDYLSDAGSFLIRTLCTLYMGVALLRFVLQLVRADYYNPISQLIVRATNPLLMPLRRIIPSIAGIDFTPLLLVVAIALAKFYLLFVVAGYQPRFAGVLVLAVADAAQLAIYIYIFAIFIIALLSWFSPSSHNPAVRLLYNITEPILRPARNILPNLGGLDFSPIVVFLILNLLSKLLVQPLVDYGRSLL